MNLKIIVILSVLKHIIVKIGNSYDNKTSYGAVIALVSACIVTKCHR